MNDGKYKLSSSLIWLGTLLLVFSFARGLTAQAQGDPAYIEAVRIFDPDFTMPHAAGLAFSPASNLFLLLDEHNAARPGEGSANLTLISPFEDWIGSTRLPAIADPINMAFDSRENRILLFDTGSRELIAIKVDPAGEADLGAMSRYEAQQYGVQDPQGMAVDPVSGALFILDGAGSRIVRVRPDARAGFNGPAALADGRISQIDLSRLGLGVLRGLAFDPTYGRLHVLNPILLKLYELNEAGKLLAARELTALDLGFRDPQGIVFAPSADLTDDPAQMHFFLLDSGLAPLTLYPLEKDEGFPPLSAAPAQENVSPAAQSLASGLDGGGPAGQGPGRIIEFTLAQPGNVQPSNSLLAVNLEVRVSASNDDAEESASGNVDLTSSDLELVLDGSNQTVGMRFNGLTIPPGAIISNAYVQFQADETGTTATSLAIQGQAADNAAAFTTATNNISSRPRTAASVSSAPPPWTTVGAAGLDQRTPNLAAVVQEIVAQPGWSSGNSLAIIITGSGRRTAEAEDGVPAAAPLLHVEYDIGLPTDTPTPGPSPTPTSTPIPVTPTSTSPVSSLTFTPVADARVLEMNPNANYGTITRLDVDSPGAESYLRFTVSGVGGAVQTATLRLFVTNSSSNGPSVYLTDNTWTETGITWNNRSAPTSGVIADAGALTDNAWVEYNVTAQVNGDGTYNFVLLPDSTDGASFYSREGSFPPQLVLAFASGPTPTSTKTPTPTNTPTPGPSPTPTTGPTPTNTPPSGGEVFVGAGDIADCSRVQDELTAQLLDNIPGTVFTVGDNAYPDGTTANFNNCYEPTWGRHKARTHPAVGDNEYDTPGASGYYNYFGAAAGDPDKGYYSYDVGAWHIIVLNSNCSEIGGCDPNSAQGEWLQADLAANPSACILAIHHEPLFSSKGGDSDLQDFWDPLYAAGADIVLSGHRHNYERFAQQNPDGAADPGRGIRQFVVGTGGSSLSSFSSSIAPNSEIRNDKTNGVLKLTLHPDRYDWVFIPIAGQTFTDSGTTLCVTP